MAIQDWLPDLNLDGNRGSRRWLPRRPDSGPSGDVELDHAVDDLARVASVTRVSALWSIGDFTKDIVEAQTALGTMLSERGYPAAVESSFGIAWVAYLAPPAMARQAARNALAGAAGRREPTWWRWS